MITSQDHETFAKWFKFAGVIPADENTVPALLDYFSSYGYPITFQTLSVAAEELQKAGRVKWERIPTPANDEVIADWLANDCPKALLSRTGTGLASVNIQPVGEYITPHLGPNFTKAVLNEAVRVLTDAGRLAYFGKPVPAPQPARIKTNKEISDSLLGQGGREVTGRINHAHREQERELTDGDIQQAMVKLLNLAQAQGHHGFVRSANLKMAELLSKGTPYPQVFETLKEDMADYTAHLFLKDTLERGIAGATTGDRSARRERYARAIEEGRKAGMKTADIAKIIAIEAEGDSSRSIR